MSRLLNDANDVNDVLQLTALRAFRAYASFQRRSSFLTWVSRIAFHEAQRFLGQRRVHHELRDIEARPETPAAAPDPHEAIAAAAQAGLLSKQQAAVLCARLADREPGWERIAVQLGMRPNHCAVVYLRAVKDLRVFLFMARPALLGGAARIKEAFAQARSAPVDPLTETEATAFHNAILEGGTENSARGLLGPLRTACEKVARFLELDLG